ncbi:ATP-binding cassette domain-containing protein [bacterium AH-315-J04]|nr:ATP-binding cassette domain-containing protein [bacterium AH-315-J04]
MNIVEIDHVTKTFGTHRAVDDLSLSVPEGCIYGFIGPNGSGKSTTLRMIMRIYYPDVGSGDILVLGNNDRSAANDLIGYLPEERGLYKKMKVRDALRFYAEIKGLRDYKKPVNDWLARMKLSDWADKKIETLSKGMAQKIQFISAVIAKPKLIILDEPFSGLDPVNMDVLREVVLDLRRDGSTIIFSTHDMSVAEKMCDYIFMIYKGKKVLDGTLNTIKDEYGQDTIRVILPDYNGHLDDLASVEKVTDLGHMQELRMAAGTDSQDLLAELMKRGRITHFELARPSLHDIFVRIAGPETQQTQSSSTLEEAHHA